MKLLLILLVTIVAVLLVNRLRAADTIPPEEAARRVQAGEAVLIDVREPAEWQGGVAEPALLLPLSDLRGERSEWKPVLEEVGDKELILYCRTGNRSGIAAGILEKEGFRTSNAGGFAAWRDANLPVRQP